ncbi:acyltransferase family protein [Novosphingobium sp. FSY-8]|uniref:Acyltransferase family protein n=1 Tax=Novosphingobium ovatum TaxID=1908523 RepID=A0ABW9XA70_9SPHN|nr:acyltransferase family protein [Novosphingobium ovatum]NBC35417.1 acyltransferase family protein [Novosphingobium ovatum]
MSSPAQPAPKTHAYRPDIDGLRAICVGVVVAFHAFWRRDFGGFVGVDIFFVISGYLISGIILDDLAAGRFSFAGFYARRVRRIYPALVLVAGVTLAAGWLQLFDDHFQQLGRHVGAAAGFVSNIVLYGESGYFDADSDVKPLLHLWSLGVEEQFYILWPLALAAAFGWRRGNGAMGRAGWVLGVALLASLAQAVHLMRVDASAAFYWPTPRFWEMLAGAGLAYAARRWRLSDGGWAGHGLSLGGMALLAGSLIWITQRVPFPGWSALPPVLAGVMLIGAGPQGCANRWALSLPPMVWLGRISYPLYLWHWPVLVLARTSGFTGPGAMAGAVGIAVALSWATARWVEPPLRHGGHGTVKTWGLLGAMALLGIGGLAVGYGGGRSATSATSAAAARQLQWQIPVGSPAQIAACRALMPERAALRGGENDFCYIAHPGRAADVMLVGDSLNLSLFPGLAARGDMNVLVAAASEAAPLYDTTTTERFDTTRLNNWRLTNQALDHAAQTPSVRVVVLSYVNGDALTQPGAMHAITDRRGGNVVPANSVDQARALFTARLRETVERLTSAGKAVVIVLPNQRMDFEIADCLNGLRPIHAAPTHPCAATPSTARAAYAGWVRAAVAGLDRVTLMDLGDRLCAGHTCPAMRQGQLLYRDRVHLSDDGSRLVAPSVAAVIHHAAMAK